MSEFFIIAISFLTMCWLCWLDSRLPQSPPCPCEAVYGLETCPDCGRDPYRDY
ncbi:hypothetical protein J8F10_09110 [Gemmata sp. G18]|uniref:Uncharacterized protein n=1 Tax=Gemmata palustris TaxID=2822762 RepID=A0ABS5BNY2_9BACT|nr:hypothetical protein [Gemmata palustris]MBP3955439.1 hypothetical protein [Gemmata palustris]